MTKIAEDIADLLENLQKTYAATSTALILLNDDDVIELLKRKGYDSGSTVRLGRRDNSYYEGIDFWESIDFVRGSSNFNLNFLGFQFMNIISLVGDALSENNYFDKSPQLEFFRHLRNGISHGNRFNLKKYNEPKKPANFKDFEITLELENQPVLFEFISTGDLFDLFDEIKLQLRAQ